MKAFLFLFVIALFSFAATAQKLTSDAPFHLKGQIVNLETHEELSFVTVYNKGQQKGVTSDSSGYFAIRYQSGDSIIFQTLGFENYVFVTDEIKSETASVVIKMQQKTYELKTVDVTAFRTAEDFKNHVMAMEVPEEPKLVIPGLEMIQSEGVSKDGVFVLPGPISALSNKFGRRAIEHRKFLVEKEGYEKQQLLSVKYNAEVVKKIIKVEDPKVIDEFMAYCKLQDSFLESANEYELIVAVNNCYDEFKQMKSMN